MRTETVMNAALQISFMHANVNVDVLFSFIILPSIIFFYVTTGQKVTSIAVLG